MTNTITSGTISAQTASLVPTIIFTSVAVTPTLLRLSVYRAQQSGAVEVLVMWEDDYGAQSLTNSGLSVVIEAAARTSVTLSATVLSGTPTYSVYWAIEVLSS